MTLTKSASKHVLTKANLKFHKDLQKVLKHNPSATLQEIGWMCNLTSGGVSWHLQALKKKKLVKRDSKGRLVVVK